MSVLSDPSSGDALQAAEVQPRLTSRDDLLAMSKAANDRATTHIAKLFKKSAANLAPKGQS